MTRIFFYFHEKFAEMSENLKKRCIFQDKNPYNPYNLKTNPYNPYNFRVKKKINPYNPYILATL